MMTSHSVTGLPVEHIDTVWAWLCATPRKGNHDAKDKAEFIDAFKNDQGVLVFDGDPLLGFVTLEGRTPGIFEAHLFSPRRIGTERLARAVACFFEHVRKSDAVRTLLFSVRAIQARLGSILYNEGVRPTGWSYYENGERFLLLVWEK